MNVMTSAGPRIVANDKGTSENATFCLLAQSGASCGQGSLRQNWSGINAGLKVGVRLRVGVCNVAVHLSGSDRQFLAGIFFRYNIGIK